MDITETFVLPEDIEIVPVKELPDSVRDTISYSDGDVAITRPRSRTTTRILDADGAALLNLFKEPKTIVEAVISYSRESNSSPQDVLEPAYTLVKRMLSEGLMVEEGSEAALAIGPSLEPGSTFNQYEIIACIQSIEDTELYKVVMQDGTLAALKLLRTPGPAQHLFEHEMEMLASLGPPVSPRLIESGKNNDLPFIVMEWIEGMPVIMRARQLLGGGRKNRQKLASLLTGIIEVYASLHKQGCLHGDVHPQNCMVQANDQVRLIDFGYAVHQNARKDMPRAGVASFYEPELAQAFLSNAHPPAASQFGEQYAVACLIYYALTGSHTQRFSAEKEDMLRQIIEDDPTPFWKHNLHGWYAVESVLQVALSKNPEARYPTMHSFADAFRKATSTDLCSFASRDEDAELEEYIHSVLADLGAGQTDIPIGLKHAPTASVNYGAAGIAAALLKISQTYDAPDILALSNAWSNRALLDSTHDAAFYNEKIDITKETVGETSLYHSQTGLQYVRALLTHAQGDRTSLKHAIESFIEVSSSDSTDLDLALGESGILLAGSLIRSLPEAHADFAHLESYCDTLSQKLWRYTQTQPCIDNCSDHYLGMAHGWAGYLYAQLRWAEAAKRPIPEGMTERLGELAFLANRESHGLRWRWSINSDTNSYMPGWCNGSSGYVFLWTLAYKLIQDPSYKELAEGAAINTWLEPGGVGNLCCGYAGRAYGLLCMFRETSDKIWLDRARQLALEAIHAPQLQDEHSITFELSKYSLYKGRVGIAALAADLRHPEESAMPLFEALPWSKT